MCLGQDIKTNSIWKSKNGQKILQDDIIHHPVTIAETNFFNDFFCEKGNFSLLLEELLIVQCTGTFSLSSIE